MKYPRHYPYRAAFLGTAAIALGLCLPPAVAAPKADQPTPTVQPEAPQPKAAQPEPAAAAATSEPSQAVTPTSVDEIAILSPLSGAVLDQPATSLTIQYPVGANVDRSSSLVHL